MFGKLKKVVKKVTKPFKEHVTAPFKAGGQLLQGNIGGAMRELTQGIPGATQLGLDDYFKVPKTDTMDFSSLFDTDSGTVSPIVEALSETDRRTAVEGFLDPYYQDTVSGFQTQLQRGAITPQGFNLASGNLDTQRQSLTDMLMTASAGSKQDNIQNILASTFGGQNQFNKSLANQAALRGQGVQSAPIAAALASRRDDEQNTRTIGNRTV